jgi:hypothetical protein
MRDGQVNVAGCPIDRCLSVGHAGGGVRPVMGSFRQWWKHLGSGDGV